jgi:hypothetical protein
MPPNNDMMKEILRLTQENNKMLHKMRRGAFMKTVLQIVFYVLLIAVPAYLYIQYMAPMVNQMMTTVQQIQGTGAQAQAQFGSFQEMLKTFADKFKAGTTTN